MPTPFSEISKLMQLEMQQSDLYKLGKLNTEIALDIISDLILNGATVDFATCKKDLEKNIPYTQTEMSTKINQSKNSLMIDLSNIEDKQKDNIILYINDIEITDFKYNVDKLINVGTINYSFKANDEVVVLFVFEGEFDEKLSHREKYIIALASYYHYLCGKIQEENRLIKQLGDKDYKVVRGNLSNDLISLKDSIWKNIRTYIIAYERQTSTVEDLM
jgi:hypothetical protein